MPAVEGHLLQVGAGYMLSKKYQDGYLSEGRKYVESTEFWDLFIVSVPQAIHDITYLFGILLTAMKSLEHMVIIQNKEEHDGPKAWYSLKATYDYNGNIEIRIRELDEEVKTHYMAKRDGYIGNFLDRI